MPFFLVTAVKTSNLHSINRLDSVAEKYCVSCKVRAGFYIPKDDILHSHHRENLKTYIVLTGWTLWRRRNVVKYELGFYIPEDAILHSHRRENRKSYTAYSMISLMVPNDSYRS
jgi:hypothetical protein